MGTLLDLLAAHRERLFAARAEVAEIEAELDELLCALQREPIRPAAEMHPTIDELVKRGEIVRQPAAPEIVAARERYAVAAAAGAFDTDVAVDRNWMTGDQWTEEERIARAAALALPEPASLDPKDGIVKQCPLCSKSFTQRSPRQKMCPDCRDEAPHQSVAALAATTPDGARVVTRRNGTQTRVCRTCKQDYAPTSPAQLRCPDCRAKKKPKTIPVAAATHICENPYCKKVFPPSRGSAGRFCCPKCYQWRSEAVAAATTPAPDTRETPIAEVLRSHDITKDEASAGARDREILAAIGRSAEPLTTTQLRDAITPCAADLYFKALRRLQLRDKIIEVSNRWRLR